jgi:hypothetical protein
LVGEDGATAAWLLIQHTSDRAFQRRCLTLMRQAVRAGQADSANLAYLTDRVLLFEGEPQRYGTQLRLERGAWVSAPVEDEERVDERRHKMGSLPSPTTLSLGAACRRAHRPKIAKRVPEEESWRRTPRFSTWAAQDSNLQPWD